MKLALAALGRKAGETGASELPIARWAARRVSCPPARFLALMKVYLKTYGCQMNERDSEQVAHELIARGYRMTAFEAEADVVLLNTCSVRDQAEQKAIGKMGMLHALHRDRPEVVFGFLGCMAQSRGASLLQEVPRLDLVVGTQKFHRMADYVDDAVSHKRRQAAEGLARDDLRRAIVDTAEETGSQETIREHVQRPGQASAFVSIMQGCNMRCTFCIVPDTRGRERSRLPGEIVAEVRGLVARGVKEVTLLGQIVNLYGRHELPRRDGQSPFVQLLEAVHEVEGLERLRFTSPHPIGFREDLVAAFARLPKLAEHVHLPLQSGSDRILRAMRRPYTAARYLALVEALRAARPGIAITTDIIVGFPGETPEDYRLTRDLADRIGFDNAFVFRYSPRTGTPAAAMAGQAEEAVKEARNHDLLEVINAHARRKHAEWVGREVEILCEGPSKHNPQRLSGRTRGNKIVVFTGAPELAGRLLEVRVVHSSGFTLYGEYAPDASDEWAAHSAAGSLAVL
jgi:tRNA-2-methylthio-N6-dimethylallyladenosine synthase